RLGALVALYEHKVFVQSAIWGINAFDQWGVELGKELGRNVYDSLTGQRPASDEDGSTRGLIDFFRGRHRGQRQARPTADPERAGRRPARCPDVTAMECLRQHSELNVLSLSGLPRSGVEMDHPKGDPALVRPHSVCWQVHSDFTSMLCGGISALMIQML